MNKMVVETPAQLAAAFLAGACPTYEEARKSPFKVVLGSAVYTFREGLHMDKAEQLARNARRMYRDK